MTRFLILSLGLLASPAGLARAHPGHFEQVAGHGHIFGFVCIGLAVGVGLWLALKDQKDAGQSNCKDSTEKATLRGKDVMKQQQQEA